MDTGEGEDIIKHQQTFFFALKFKESGSRDHYSFLLQTSHFMYLYSTSSQQQLSPVQTPRY